MPVWPLPIRVGLGDMVMGSSRVGHDIVALLSLRVNFEDGIVQLQEGALSLEREQGIRC
jgi:hypothetical protein